MCPSFAGNVRLAATCCLYPVECSDAVGELREIIRQSDQGTREAANVNKDDRKERAAWWANRSALDKRLKELLENIEFCWLGAFKVRPCHRFSVMA